MKQHLSGMQLFFKCTELLLVRISNIRIQLKVIET